jgi:hypothetical protein
MLKNKPFPCLCMPGEGGSRPESLLVVAALNRTCMLINANRVSGTPTTSPLSLAALPVPPRNADCLMSSVPGGASSSLGVAAAEAPAHRENNCQHSIDTHTCTPQQCLLHRSLTSSQGDGELRVGLSTTYITGGQPIAAVTAEGEESDSTNSTLAGDLGFSSGSAPTGPVASSYGSVPILTPNASLFATTTPTTTSSVLLSPAAHTTTPTTNTGPRPLTFMLDRPCSNFPLTVSPDLYRTGSRRLAAYPRRRRRSRKSSAVAATTPATSSDAGSSPGDEEFSDDSLAASEEEEEDRAELVTRRLQELADSWHRGKLSDSWHRGELADSWHRGMLSDSWRRGKLADNCHRGELADSWHRGELADSWHRGKLSDSWHRGELSDSLHLGELSDSLHLGEPHRRERRAAGPTQGEATLLLELAALEEELRQLSSRQQQLPDPLEEELGQLSTRQQQLPQSQPYEEPWLSAQLQQKPQQQPGSQLQLSEEIGCQQQKERPNCTLSCDLPPYLDPDGGLLLCYSGKQIKTTQLIVPAEQLFNQANQRISPADQLIDPADQLINPSDQLLCPDDQLISPVDLLVSPSDQLINPANKVASLDGQVALASNLFHEKKGQTVEEPHLAPVGTNFGTPVAFKGHHSPLEQDEASFLSTTADPPVADVPQPVIAQLPPPVARLRPPLPPYTTWRPRIVPLPATSLSGGGAAVGTTSLWIPSVEYCNSSLDEKSSVKMEDRSPRMRPRLSLPASAGASPRGLNRRLNLAAVLPSKAAGR